MGQIDHISMSAVIKKLGECSVFSVQSAASTGVTWWSWWVVKLQFALHCYWQGESYLFSTLQNIMTTALIKSSLLVWVHGSSSRSENLCNVFWELSFGTFVMYFNVLDILQWRGCYRASVKFNEIISLYIEMEAPYSVTIRDQNYNSIWVKMVQSSNWYSSASQKIASCLDILTGSTLSITSK